MAEYHVIEWTPEHGAVVVEVYKTMMGAVDAYEALINGDDCGYDYEAIVEAGGHLRVEDEHGNGVVG